MPPMQPSLADVVTATPADWFDGLDPATAWALVWVADTATTPTASELISMAGRFGSPTRACSWAPMNTLVQ